MDSGKLVVTFKESTTYQQVEDAVKSVPGAQLYDSYCRKSKSCVVALVIVPDGQEATCIGKFNEIPIVIDAHQAVTYSTSAINNGET